MAWTVLRGGRVLDIAADTAEFADHLDRGRHDPRDRTAGLPAPTDAVEVSAQHRLLHPGLVNAHTHGHGNLAKGMGDRWTLELLLTAAPWITGNRSLDDRYLSTQLGAVEMVMKGCTACYDLSFEWPLPTAEGLACAARAYADLGMRAVLAPMVADRSFFEAIPGLIEALPPALQRRAAALRLPPAAATLDGDARRPRRLELRPRHGCARRWRRRSRIIARTTSSAAAPIWRASSRSGCTAMSANSKVQAVTGIRRYGMTQTAKLDALGVLGPHFTVAHGVWLDDDDMRRLGDHGASVAHNPGSNMRLGSGLADTRAMLERRVNLGIGTDGANCSDNQNMYEAMRLASFVSKVRGPDWRRWLSTREAARAATEGGARALGFGDRIGRLAPGCKADIVMLDLDHPNWLPLNDPVNQLVHSEDGTAVASVMIGGRLVVDNRRVVGIDLARLRQRAEAARERLAAANADNRRLYEALEPVVGSHCPGLARAPYHIHRYGAPLDG